MKFVTFKDAVALRFKDMCKDDMLFRVDVSNDELWETYLKSFPNGSNPMFKTRTEHDCSCCKQFIRTVGNVVAVRNGELISVWDVSLLNEAEYQEVANAMTNLVTSRDIVDVFYHYEKTAGTNRSFVEMTDGVHTWDHFHVNIPDKFVLKKSDIPAKCAHYKDLYDVFKRSLLEISADSVDTVLELISQNSIYRGEENKFAVESFRKIQRSVMGNPEIFTLLWAKIKDTPASVLKIKNTAIGTLLCDLSEGKDIEDAVKAFERIVAPMNYKRPTALVTQAMVDNARKKIEELGFLSALERRYANINDITINNILFANRDSKKKITGDMFDGVANKSTKNQKMFDKVEEVSIDKFISDILPNADSIELMVENKHSGNLVSLVAPKDPTAKNMFKWDNNFSWAYNGDYADSIKERVKNAGGNVTGDFCCRLGWFNYDDLDFHMIEPTGHEIMYTNKGRKSSCGGMLDVDMNAGGGHTRTAVENIFYTSMSTMKEGIYDLRVHNFSKRESTDVGFEVEVDILGTVYNFVYTSAVNNNQTISVVKFMYSKKDGIIILESLPNSTKSKNIWNIKTMEFHNVNVMMMSPNFWNDREVGNKHYFFMLDQCVNDGTARGFFNEFLIEELNPHRKVIEIVGSKMKTSETDNQLSGLGFSSTQRNNVLCRVKGSFTRTIKINF